MYECDGIGEDDSRLCTWWYGGEALSSDTCMVFELAEDMLSGVTGNINLAREGMFECEAGGVGSWGGSVCMG